ANMFVDCTGDGLLALKSGAECRYGRESFAESGEMSAPMVGDNLVMGSSNQWCSEYCDKKEPFDKKQWMFNFTEEYHFSLGASSWSWESGFANLHTYKEAEEVRDNNLRAIYSHWAYALNNIEGFDHYRLKEVMYMAGKRETYRIVGDMVLTQNDIVNKVNYEDAVVTTSWGIDIHYPDTINSKYFPGEEFVAYAVHPSREKDIYTIPYRCFYSKDIDNLFMAGRNISVTHIALGTVRVQRTTAMMGEMVGIAAWLCKELKTSPRGLYQNHLNELLEKLQ
ncbi:MAG: FAD-dependent oxidoreductase, partial [Rikenellaceae bacterium]